MHWVKFEPVHHIMMSYLFGISYYNHNEFCVSWLYVGANKQDVLIRLSNVTWKISSSCKVIILKFNVEINFNKTEIFFFEIQHKQSSDDV